MLWVALTILASAVQVFRNSFQKNLLSSGVSDVLSSWARFILILPISICFVSYYAIYRSDIIAWHWILLTFIAAILQILGNVSVIKCLKSGKFAIGTSLFKTEGLQTAILELIFLSTIITAHHIVIIFVGFVGIVILTGNFKSLDIKEFATKSTLYGLLAGFIFAVCGIFIKHAIYGHQYVSHETAFVSGITILLFVNLIQNIVFAVSRIYLGDLSKTLEKFISCKRDIVKLGTFNIVGSVCWFWAFALAATATYVKAVGQIEIIFSIFLSHYCMREKMKGYEIVGSFLIIASSIAIIAI